MISPRGRLTSDLASLHVLTGNSSAFGRNYLDIATAALTGGARVIQLRDKTKQVAELIDIGHQLRRLTRDHGALLIVNDHINLALHIDADGVHVGQSDMRAKDVRRFLGADKLLGVSARTIEEAEQAEADGADYIGWGPVFVTPSTSDSVESTGLDALWRASDVVSIPLIAIGGIDATTIDGVLAAGASGVAVVSAVLSALDIELATRQLVADRFAL